MLTAGGAAMAEPIARGVAEKGPTTGDMAREEL